MTIVAFGDSHLEAIKLGYKEILLKGPLPTSIDFIRIPPKSVSEQLPEHLKSDIDLIAWSLAGNWHFVNGAINSPRPLDCVLPNAPHLARLPSTELIPFDLARHSIFAELKVAISAIGPIRSKAGVPVHLISPPPPVGNCEAIEKHIKQAAAYTPSDLAQRMESQLQRYGVAPPVLRYKLWSILIDAMRQVCRDAMLSFVEVPAGASDSNGFLADEFRHDGFHANARYGHLVIQQLLELSKTRAPHAESLR